MPILDEVIQCLVGQIRGQILPALDEAERLVYDFLHNFRPFIRVVKTAIKQGLEKAFNLLHIIKDEVVGFCRKNKDFMTKLTKLVTKSASREVMTVGIKQVIRYGAAEVGQQAVQGVLRVTNPAGLVADVTQTGMELAGYEKAGKTVGMLGNIGTGAVSGAMIAGPVGLTVGALAGFLTWGAGEVTGAVIQRALS